MEEYYQHSEALLKCHNFKTGFSYMIHLFSIMHWWISYVVWSYFLHSNNHVFSDH